MPASPCMCCFLFCKLLCTNRYQTRNAKQENDELSDIYSSNPLLNVSNEQIIEQPHASTSVRLAEDVLESKVEEVNKMEKNQVKYPLIKVIRTQSM